MPLRFREVVDHSPFSGDGFRWRMGVRSLAADRWLQPDDRRTTDLVEKERLTSLHPGQTFVAQPESVAAATEVRDLVAVELDRFGLALGRERSHPLETAGLSLQEDLCLMELIEGQWVMTAGSVCFPTRWDLPSKLGRSIAEIHEPVPGYGEELGSRVERFFDRLAPGSPALRFNWSLVGDRARRLDARERQAPSELPSDPATDVFMRIERQTLRRLRDHDAIVFGIRIHVWPLGEVVADLPVETFARQLETASPEVARYKDLDGMRAELASWLRRAAV